MLAAADKPCSLILALAAAPVFAQNAETRPSLAEAMDGAQAMAAVGNYLFVSAPGDGDGRVDIWYRGPNGYLLIQQLFVPASIAGGNCDAVDATFVDGQVTDPQDWTSDLAAIGEVTSFGLDGAGNLYTANWDGEIHRIVPVR